MSAVRRARRVFAARLLEWWATRRGASALARQRFVSAAHASADSVPRTIRCVLVAPPGAGNIGDQAMVEAFLERAEGRVVVVQRRAGDITVPAGCAAQVELVALGALIYGPPSDRDIDLRTFQRLIEDAESVAVVGADMMDGTYSLQGSVHRLLLAELSALAGVPTTILGFSWSGQARPAATRGLRAAAAAGAVPLLRDPDSAARVRAAGVQGVVAGSDIVFAATSVDHTTLTELSPRPERYIVLNVSALVRRQVSAQEYVPIVERLLASGYHVVLLPHVLRGSSNDLPACREVFELVADPRVQLIERALSPAQIRGLAADARFVIAGRMHLAIMAMRSGVPAITFSTQGKVSGLMSLFDVERLCVTPGVGMAATVIALIDELDSSDAARVTIAERLPDVIALAEHNFGALPVPHIQTTDGTLQ